MFVIVSQKHPDAPYLSAILPNGDDPLLAFTADKDRALKFKEESSCKIFICSLNFTFDEDYPFTLRVI